MLSLVQASNLQETARVRNSAQLLVGPEISESIRTGQREIWQPISSTLNLVRSIEAERGYGALTMEKLTRKSRLIIGKHINRKVLPVALRVIIGAGEIRRYIEANHFFLNFVRIEWLFHPRPSRLDSSVLHLPVAETAVFAFYQKERVSEICVILGCWIQKIKF